jgi:short-chain fatty acids transporter
MKKRVSFPSPLAIALLLTALVFGLALWSAMMSGSSLWEGTSNLSLAWYNGLWDNSSGGLHFAFQMIFILVLGHVLALTAVFRVFIGTLTRFCTNSSNTAVTISITAIVLAYINWGLALVLAALMVKHVLQKFQQLERPINVGLVGASAYVSMLVWHGGISGSSPTKAMEENALREMMLNAGYQVQEGFPSAIPARETLFSAMNVAVFFAMLILIPLLLSWLAKRNIKSEVVIEKQEYNDIYEAFKFKFNWTTVIGIAFLVVAVCVAVYQSRFSNSGFLNVNFINFCLFGLAILLHNDLTRFADAVRIAIGDAAGILVQFPLYFGIIGLMKAGGLSEIISQILVESATKETFPVLAFLSAGLLNFFIPSGGGQFYVQGPMLIQSASELGVSIPKTIMALSYGDQWTNMLQPFWALPLLGITKIKLDVIFPYCFALFALSGVVFIGALVFF